MTGVFVNSASESTLRLNVICEILEASCDGNSPTPRAGTPGLPLINDRIISLPGTAPTFEGSVRKTPERKGRRTFSYSGPSEERSSATFAFFEAELTRYFKNPILELSEPVLCEIPAKRCDLGSPITADSSCSATSTARSAT